MMRDWGWAERILHIDEDLLVVCKPSGIFTHPSPLSRERQTLLSELRDFTGRWVYPLHRLDRPTSGVALFTFSGEVASLFGALFRERRLGKRYWAMVRGWPPAEGVVERSLKTPETQRMQEAETAFRTLARADWPVPLARYPGARFALVEAEPRTGRWHQIRRHLRGIDHPVLSDAVHGDLRANHYVRDHLGVQRLLLHAAQITFIDPRDGTERVFEAPLEPDMAALCARFNWPTKPVGRPSPDPSRPA
ncbi:MAG: pseudouridine synthase [Opitutales bacterium]